MMEAPNFCCHAALALSVAISALAPISMAQAYTETVLYSFAGGSDGAFPESNLIADDSGNLFGTTVAGGGACKKNQGCGTVFELAPDGTETILHAFTGGNDGRWPADGLVMDQQGNLYGTTPLSNGGNGTVFEVTQSGSYSVVYNFKGGADGDAPMAGLITDEAGNLYGTTSSGGTANCACGTVFELTPGGVHTVLYSFQGTLDGGTDGSDPQAPLVFDSAGNLYGTTVIGGDSRCGGGGCGTVFKLTPGGTETVLHAFRNGKDGNGPSGGLIIDASGNLYGTTGGGGGTGCGGLGCGTVFEVTADGNETILSDFNRTGGPAGPVGGVIMDRKGNLYGSASGVTVGCGWIYKVPSGARAKSLYSFTCGSDGGYPHAGLLRDRSGNLYGTTAGGGSNKYGTIFALKK